MTYGQLTDRVVAQEDSRHAERVIKQLDARPGLTEQAVLGTYPRTGVIERLRSAGFWTLPPRPPWHGLHRHYTQNRRWWPPDLAARLRAGTICDVDRDAAIHALFTRPL